MAKEIGGRTTADAPESAALDLGRSAQAVRASRADVGERPGKYRCEYLALIAWAEANHKRLPFTYIEQFTYVSAGAEHRVYFDPKSNLAIKTTLPNKFGHSAYGPGYQATPVDYFERLAWQNAIFGDDIRIVGIAYEEEQLEVITSQPWIKGHPIRPVPFAEEIETYLLRFGFRRVPLVSDAPLFYSEEQGLIVADAHDQNILRDFSGEMAAIDVVVGTPGPELRREIEQAFAAAG